IRLYKNSNPNVNNYVLTNYGIPASTPEWYDGRFSEVKQDSIDVTKSLEWLSNVIIEHCREFDIKEPYIIENYYTSNEELLTLSNTRTEIEEFRMEFESPFDGIALVE